MTNHAGRCQCGEISFVVEGRPNNVTNCHCRMCQKSSGAPFVTWVEFPSQQIQWKGAEPRWYASSEEAQRGFCPSCGTPVAFRYASSSDIDLPCVLFDELAVFSPEDEVWVYSRQPWTVLNAKLPHHPKGRTDD